MIREIKIYPDDILRKKCLKINSIESEEKRLIKDMKETMYAKEGVGLAAPQVGVCKRIIVLDIDDGAGIRVFINPEIIEKEGKSFPEEGCLSLPDKNLKVERFEKIKVKALNAKNEEFDLTANGLLSYAIQHEIDHLNGILIIDRATPLEKIKDKFFR